MYFFIVQQSIFMNFKIFLLIFALPIFLSKYPPIFTDISDISVQSKYRYIRNYRYFVSWIPSPPAGHPIAYEKFVMDKYIKEEIKHRIFIHGSPIIQISYVSKT